MPLLAILVLYICQQVSLLLQLEGWFWKVSLKSTPTRLLWKLQHSFPTFLLYVNLANRDTSASQLWIKKEICQNTHLAFLSPPFLHLLHLRYLNTMPSADILALHLEWVHNMLKTMTFLKSHLWQGDGFLSACLLQVWYRHLSVKHCVKLELWWSRLSSSLLPSLHHHSIFKEVFQKSVIFSVDF